MNPKSLEHLKRYKWKRLVVCWPVEGLWKLIWVKLSKNSNRTHSIHVWCIFTYVYHKNRLNVRKYTIHGWYYSYAHQDFRKAILNQPLLGVPPRFHDVRKFVPRQGRCGRNSSHANGRGGVFSSSPGALVEWFFVGKWQGLEQSFNQVFFSMVHGRFIVYGVVGYDWASLHSDWQGQIGSWYHWYHTIVLPTPTRFLWNEFFYTTLIKKMVCKSSAGTKKIPGL